MKAVVYFLSFLTALAVLSTPVLSDSHVVEGGGVVAPAVEGEDTSDHETIPKITAKAQTRFSLVSQGYNWIKALLSDKTDIRFFASITTMSFRLVRDGEEETNRDPGEPKPVRFAMDDGILRGQLNLGYYLEPYLQVIGSVGVFIEADVTDLRGETDVGIFGYGLFLTGPEGLTLGKYINPILAGGYRPQEDIFEDLPDGRRLRTTIGAMDPSNLFVSINFKVPISCVIDPDVCKDLP